MDKDFYKQQMNIFDPVRAQRRAREQAAAMQPAQQAALMRSDVDLPDRPEPQGLRRELMKMVPIAGAPFAMQDAYRASQQGNVASGLGEALSQVPGYGLSKAAVAQGPAHVLPLFGRGIAQLRTALGRTVARKQLGNAGQLKDAAELGYVAAQQ